MIFAASSDISTVECCVQHFYNVSQKKVPLSYFDNSLKTESVSNLIFYNIQTKFHIIKL